MERKEDEKNRRKDTKNVKKEDKIKKKLRRERSRKRMGNRDHTYLCCLFYDKYKHTSQVKNLHTYCTGYTKWFRSTCTVMTSLKRRAMCS